MIYLAIPYSHPDPKVRETRFEYANWASSRFIKAGVSVFSPISHSHPISKYGVKGDWQQWFDLDWHMLRACKQGLVVLALEGWDESVGVLEELRLASTFEIPVFFLTLSELREGSGVICRNW